MIDSHCHLADEAFEADLDAVIDRAQRAGMTGALCILAAGDEVEAGRAEAVRGRWNAVRFSAGVHPHNAKDFEGRAAESAATTRATADRFAACAIGEIGLDYHYDFSPPAIQQSVFEAQIALAVELRKPVIIHTREAEDDTFAMLRNTGTALTGGVFHCFTGDDRMARRALDIGFHVSFAGIVTFPKAGTIREAAKLVPLDRLLVETDSPYLAPVPFRGKRNEPAHVGRVLDVLAELRGESRASLAERTAANFARLFTPAV
jgi:TatD DNase family protein